MTRFEIAQNLANSLERERELLGLSQSEMAEKLELSLSAYKRIITLTTVKIDLYTVCKFYGLTGKVDYSFMGISDCYSEVIRKMAELSPLQLGFIESLVDFEYEFKSRKNDCNGDMFISVYIPTGNMEDGMICDSANVEKVRLSERYGKYGDKISCGIRITSNHLHPVYNLGDILLISKRPIRDGDTGIFVNRDNGRVYIRKFHQTEPCMLEPVNNYGDIFYVDSKNKDEMDNWIKFGVVVSKLR